MKIIITKRPPPQHYPGTELERYRPQCPYCGEVQNHDTLLWRAARDWTGKNRKVPGIEEFNTTNEGFGLFFKHRKFKCHTCGCEWKVRK